MFKNFSEDAIHTEDFLRLFHLYKEFSKTKTSKETQVETMTDNLLNENFDLNGIAEHANLNDAHALSMIPETLDNIDNESELLDIENIPIIIEENANNDLNMPSTSSDYNEETALNQSILNDFITWPITPKRKGKRQSEKPPFVLTSSVRKEAEKKKIALKKESEMQKEKRKAERLKKKQIKEHSNKKGKQIKGKETLMKRSKDAIISGFNKTLLETETKMPNILENIQETNEEVRVAKDNYQLKIQR
jgi:hypothetical protein